MIAQKYTPSPIHSLWGCDVQILGMHEDRASGLVRCKRLSDGKEKFYFKHELRAVGGLAEIETAIAKAEGRI